MNAATSQEVFAGPYLDDPVEKEKFSAAFMDMTQVCLFPFPGCELCVLVSLSWQHASHIWRALMVKKSAGEVVQHRCTVCVRRVVIICVVVRMAAPALFLL